MPTPKNRHAPHHSITIAGALLLLLPSLGWAQARTATDHSGGAGHGNRTGEEPVEPQALHEKVVLRRPAPPPAFRLQSPSRQLQINATFTVTTPSDTGAGSLRSAIAAANASPGLDLITFGISGPTTIAPHSPLPAITDPVIIDGTTQPGFAGMPLIELTGALAGPNASGLVITGGNSTVRGLVIHSFATNGSAGFGVVLDVRGQDVIEGCYIGTNAAGTAALPNAVSGIVIFGPSSGNLIGGTTPQARNVISGNTHSGVQIAQGNVGGNVLRGNYIGLNAAGTAVVANGGNGVFVDSPDDTIGGSIAGARNVISGNVNPGIFIGVDAARVVVQGNYIGTDVTGQLNLGSPGNGVNIDRSSNNVIGGTTVAGRNVISGNALPGVYIIGPGASGNLVQGNFIGIGANGTVALGRGNGVIVDNANNNTIGGVTPGARNVISGLPFPSIDFINGATGNRVIGNYVGTDSAGAAAVPNSKGVLTNSSPGNTIGGATPAERNIISGNASYGIEIRGAASTGTKVSGNFIGTDVSGAQNLGNGLHGVVITCSQDTIGGSTASAGNVIAFNGGVGVYDSTGTGNLIQFNSFFGNKGLGIDLFPRGITPNDSLDSDTGANGLQNFPLLDSMSVVGGTIRVRGHLDSQPGRQYLLEFFGNDSANASHFGEGRIRLGTLTMTCDANGRADITFLHPMTIPPNFITATATDDAGSTSEFSQCLCTHDDDGDGIPDCWETQSWGMDVNSDGVIDEDLYAQGARPNHKDLFVEVDAMTGYAPPPQALQMVVDAFARVPNVYLGNPDGAPGIALHVTRDETTIPVQDLNVMWADFEDLKRQWFGTFSERSGPNSRYTMRAKRLVWRYALWCRTFCSDSDSLNSGLTKAVIPGTYGYAGPFSQASDGFLVSLGSTGMCGWNNPTDVGILAGTFMHELGHSLGLLHGGQSVFSYKPNYYSVMNYTWQTPHRKWQAPGSWRLDYSPVALPPLDESHLDERVGLNPPPGVWPIVSLPYSDAHHRIRQARLEPGASVDWDGNGSISADVAGDIDLVTYGSMNCVGLTDTSTSPGETHTGFADWSNLKFSFRDSPGVRLVPRDCPDSAGVLLARMVAAGPAAGATALPVELTRREYDALEALPPPKPEGRFVMDGVLDPGAQLLASNAGINLYGRWQGGQFYLATNAAPAQAADMVVLVASSRGALRAAPLGKAGQVGAWSALLWNRSADDSAAWSDAGGNALTSVTADSSATVLEGVVDVGLLFGSNPADLYVAVGKYAPGAGGALLAQAPAGNGDGNIDPSEFYHLLATAGVGGPSLAAEGELRLSIAWPNPAGTSARVRLELPRASDVDVRVVDVAGRTVAVIGSGRLEAGEHELTWSGLSSEGRRQRPGVYFVRAHALGETRTARVVLLH